MQLHTWIFSGLCSSGIQSFELTIFAVACANFNAFYSRQFRPCPGPGYHGVDRLRRTLNHGFHGTVAAISDPAGDAELLSLAAHGLTEKYALNMTVNFKVLADLH